LAKLTDVVSESKKNRNKRRSIGLVSLVA